MGLFSGTKFKKKKGDGAFIFICRGHGSPSAQELKGFDCFINKEDVMSYTDFTVPDDRIAVIDADWTERCCTFTGKATDDYYDIVSEAEVALEKKNILFDYHKIHCYGVSFAKGTIGDNKGLWMMVIVMEKGGFVYHNPFLGG